MNQQTYRGVFPIVAVSICLLAAGCDRLADRGKGASPTVNQATAVLQPKGDSGLSGTARFEPAGDEITFHIQVQNAPPGSHAVHIHEIGDCSSPDGKSAGGHWNPTGEEHGKWGTPPHHLGDIGNLEIDSEGNGEMTLKTGRWSIGGPAGTDVVGRAIIVHAGADDLASQPTGNAGGRIGCGVINSGS